MLSLPYRELHVEVPVRMDDGHLGVCADGPYGEGVAGDESDGGVSGAAGSKERWVPSSAKRLAEAVMIFPRWVCRSEWVYRCSERSRQS